MAINFIGDFSDFLIKYARKGAFDGEANARMAAHIAQGACCYVTKRPLQGGDRELHRILPGEYGGKYTPENTVYVCKLVHQLIHGTHPWYIDELLEKVNPTPEQMRLINQLRRKARRPVLERKAAQDEAA